MRPAAEFLLAFVALYPVCTAALWMAGGLLFRFFEEESSMKEPEGGWPGVTVLIPAYNEASVIGTCVEAVLSADYPTLEVLVLDDGSTDNTESAARAAAGGDERCRVLRDPVNHGKADRLNFGFQNARHELVAVTDADTHVHPQALKLLVARICRTPMLAAVAGAPHVTNRGRFLLAMQILEAAAIIGLIRRTQAVAGRVGVVAGVLALFRRDRVLEVGGYDPRMATEDIELTWKLLLAGWLTTYEPKALVGMEVPSSLRALWAQRTRWARGQGEVLHVHFGEVLRWRNHRMWLLGARVACLAGLDHRPRRSARIRSACRHAGVRRGPLRLRLRLGDCDRSCRHHPADRRARAGAPIRPVDSARVPRRPSLPARLLDDQRRRRPPLAGRRPSPRSARKSASSGTSRASHWIRNPAQPRRRRAEIAR